MTKPASEKPIRGKALLTSYTVIWSMLGALGLGYLGVAIFEPAWLGDLTPVSGYHNSETQEAMMNLSTDVAGLAVFYGKAAARCCDREGGRRHAIRPDTTARNATIGSRG